MYLEPEPETEKVYVRYTVTTLLILLTIFVSTGDCTSNTNSNYMSLDLVLSQLDDTATKCSDTIVSDSVHRLIQTTLEQQESWPDILEMANMLANHAEPNVMLNKLATWRDKSMLIPRPSYLMNFSLPQYFLQLECSENRSSWVPVLAFATKKSSLCLLIKPVLTKLDACGVPSCRSSKCIKTIHGRLRIHARECCSNDTSVCLSVSRKLHFWLMAINTVCAFVCACLIPFAVWMRLKPQELRSWALIEVLLFGAAVLYCVLLIDFFTQSDTACWWAVWLRQLGFTMFYGSVTLKMYRIVQEYRVRKAPHIFVKEEDLLKYFAYVLGLTITGLTVWTFATKSTEQLSGTWPQCAAQPWSLTWYVFEVLLLFIGLRLCIKGRHSGGTEKWRFLAVLSVELIVTFIMNSMRYAVRHTAHSDLQILLAFLHLHLTITPNLVIILVPKFIAHARKEKEGPQMPTGASARSHPSLAKLRDQLINGTVEFAEVPISEMNPEDIRAELKRVYTELRMYKLKNIYQDNPHIIKGKGGKKKTEKSKIRRTSTPSSNSPKTRHVEEDEKSDPTVESAPHNVYLSTYKLQIEPQQSIRV